MQNTFRGDFPPEFQSAAQPYHRPPSHGVQYHALETSGAQEVVGVPHPHMAADLQVSGEAGYTDDIKLSSDALVAVLVTSSKPHARLTRVDASKALEVTGFSLVKGSASGWVRLHGRGLGRPCLHAMTPATLSGCACCAFQDQHRTSSCIR
eukprot:scaffold2301_cov21-Tisochrysis_lutea.AAC.1